MAVYGSMTTAHEKTSTCAVSGAFENPQ